MSPVRELRNFQQPSQTLDPGILPRLMIDEQSITGTIWVAKMKSDSWPNKIFQGRIGAW
jgi:hypothetical protein